MFSVFFGSLQFSLLRLKHDYSDRFSSFKFFLVPLNSSLFSESCKPTPRGVYPPSFQGQLISFYLGVLDLSLHQETKKKGRHDCNEMEKTSLQVIAGKSHVFPQGWIIKMLVVGETLNIFLLTGILNINIFFIKKKNTTPT